MHLPKLLPAIVLLLAICATSCSKKKECVDCHEPGTNHFFTFCDPAEPSLDSLDCGAVYKTR